MSVTIIRLALSPNPKAIPLSNSSMTAVQRGIRNIPDRDPFSFQSGTMWSGGYGLTLHAAFDPRASSRSVFL